MDYETLRTDNRTTGIELTDIEKQSLRSIVLIEQRGGISYPANWRDLLLLRFMKEFTPDLLAEFSSS